MLYIIPSFSIYSISCPSVQFTLSTDEKPFKLSRLKKKKTTDTHTRPLSEEKEKYGTTKK